MIALPPLADGMAWSIRVVDQADGSVVAEHDPDRQLETASIGKLFLLVEVARRFEDGGLDPAARLEVPAAHRVEDSGLLYRMRDQRIALEDAALLVGAFSDNLATNGLIHVCGLDDVRSVAPELGYADTSLHDYIRDERGAEHPWTPSYGTARELADLMGRLAAGRVVSPAVSARVLHWLAADADTSMVAGAFLLDPLAHEGSEYQGMSLRHKTGSVGFARIDVGHLVGPAASVAYAVGANWKDSPVDRRADALSTMHAVGEEIRRYVTGLAREQETPR